MADILDKLKKAVSMEEQQEKGLLSTIDEATTLTWKQRIYGFGICFGIGCIITLIAIPMLWMFMFTAFGVMYSLGSIVSLASTCFLMGPLKQIKKMADPHRLAATIVYILSIVATLVVALKLKSAGLVIICLIIQILALFWYCLTWIPGGQAMLKAMIFRT